MSGQAVLSRFDAAVEGLLSLERSAADLKRRHDWHRLDADAALARVDAALAAFRLSPERRDEREEG
jgi:hypothetical protein